ncbi:MAG: DinB family protein [Bacteroidota bacterium]
MTESPQQYAARISSYVTGKNFLQQLQKSPKRIATLLRGKRTSQMIRRISAEKWSVVEILAHLTEGEIVFGYRLRLIASVSGTPVQAYDQNLWQANAGYLRKNPKETLNYFETLRSMNVAFIKSLPQDALDRFGMHAERGQESIRRMMELYAGHDENHIRQLAAILKLAKKQRSKK